MNRSALFITPLISVLLSSHGASAQTPSETTAPTNECQINPQFADQVIPSDGVSGNYWTNLMDDHTVLFTADGGTSGRFQAYDLKTKTPIRLTQEIDPFPAPDGRRIYIHPSPIRFFEFDTIRDKVEKQGVNPDDLAQLSYDGALSPSDTPAPGHSTIQKRKNPKEGPSFQDNDNGIQGYYESMASLGRHEDKDKKENYSDYRVLTGEGEGSIKDYRVTFGANDKILAVTPLSKAKPLCPNLRGNSYETGLDFDTPIISPKGNEFAVVDRQTRSTVIVKFDAATGKCTKEFDFGFETGKVHFSPDGSKIAFHADTVGEQNDPLAQSNLPRPYVYDRNTKKLTSLSLGDLDDNAQGTFPVFRKDGKILYQRSSYDRNTGKSSRAWVIVDPNKFNSIHLTGGKACNTDPKMAALSELWKTVCEGKTKNRNFLDWTLTVDPKVCKSFVADHYQDYVKANAEAGTANAKLISKESMARACPTKTLPKTGLSLATSGAKQNLPLTIQNRCVICHTKGSPHGYIPWDNPEEMRKMKAIGASAQPGHPYAGKTFLEQVSDIVEKNKNTNDPGAGIPRVPADGNRLNGHDVTEILDWVKNGSFGKYAPNATTNTHVEEAQ